jgi:hypothetical protein
MSERGEKTYRPWEPERYRQDTQSPAAKLPEGDESREMLGVMPLQVCPQPQGPCPDTSA